MYIYSRAVNDAPTYMTQAQSRRSPPRRRDRIPHRQHTRTSPYSLAAQRNNELSQSKATLQQMFGPSAALDFASPFRGIQRDHHGEP